MDVVKECSCNVPEPMSLAKVTKESLDLLSPPQIRQIANAHNVGEGGVCGPGHSIWRHNTTKTELITAILAHKTGAVVPPAVVPKPATVDAPIPKLMDHSTLDEGVRAIAQLVAERVFDTKVKPELEKVKPHIDLVEIRHIIDEEINKIRGSFLEIKISLPDEKPKNVGRQHSKFPKLVNALESRTNIMLVGPAGSGKTEACLAYARGKGMDFELMSVGPQTTQSDLSGYRDANGTYRESPPYRAFRDGKLLIIDEMDAGNGGVFTFLNALTSNDFAGFPCGVVQRNPKFQAIACANTYGTGADMLYVGRAQLDGATLDRWVPLVWDYDEGFELDLALAQNKDARAWVETVWKYRRNMIASKMRHIISPRASINGAKLMKHGFKQSELEQMLIFRGLNKELVAKLKGPNV